MRTPLHKAAYYSGAPEVISSLISRGADVNAVDKGNWTALHLAARNGHVEAMRLLLDAGTRTDVRDTKHGWTAPGFSSEQTRTFASGTRAGRTSRRSWRKTDSPCVM